MQVQSYRLSGDALHHPGQALPVSRQKGHSHLLLQREVILPCPDQTWFVTPFWSRHDDPFSRFSRPLTKRVPVKTVCWRDASVGFCLDSTVSDYVHNNEAR